MDRIDTVKDLKEKYSLSENINPDWLILTFKEKVLDQEKQPL